VITFKFRETLEKKGAILSQILFFENKQKKQTKVHKDKIRIQKDRCRDSMEVVLTNRVDCVALVK